MSEQSGQQAVRLTIRNPEASDHGDPYFEPQPLDHLSDREHIFIGRSPSNDISFDAASVSGKHACITRQGNDYFVCDLQSRNGTFLNGTQLAPNEQHPLRSGDTIRVTPYEIGIRFGLDVLVESSENTQMLQQQLLQQILPGLFDYEEVPPKLVLVSGFAGPLFLELNGLNTDFKIGRSPHCDLVIQDENISREHVHIRRLTKGVFVRDNNSRNGVVVNGSRIPRNTEVRIYDRDEVVLGTIKLRFEDPEGEKFSGKVDEVVAPEPEPVVDVSSVNTIPKPDSPPPEPYVPGGMGTEQHEESEEQSLESSEDSPIAVEGEEHVDAESTDAPAEGEEGTEDKEEGVAQHPTGLTGGQKAIIGVLVTLLIVGFVLLLFFTGN